MFLFFMAGVMIPARAGKNKTRGGRGAGAAETRREVKRFLL
jgi:hypothetical protein